MPQFCGSPLGYEKDKVNHMNFIKTLTDKIGGVDLQLINIIKDINPEESYV